MQAHRLSLAILPILAILFSAACEKKEGHASALGACMVAGDCTITLKSPEGVVREVRCDGPAKKGTLTCSCVDNSVVGKEVHLTKYPSSLDEATSIASTACGW